MDKKLHEYVVAENQHSTYALVIDKTSNAEHQHVRFYLERNAKLVAEILIDHANAHVTIECVLRGSGADAHIAGAYVLGTTNAVQINSLQHHTAPHTTSNLVMKGIVNDSAHAQYRGTIRVEKEARGTHTAQENKNMLLSNNARALSIPSLEVLTNDVHCFHGSATGRCDEEQLFYCAARGIDEKNAQRLLLQAFVADLFVSNELNEKVLGLIE